MPSLYEDYKTVSIIDENSNPNTCIKAHDHTHSLTRYLRVEA